MSIEKGLYALAKHVQDLLGCDSVSVLLGGAEATLCHPLLKKLLANDSSLYVTAADPVASPPFYHKSIVALCDIASQTGTIWGIESVRLNDGSLGSLIAFPLESLDGVLGLLLCTCHNLGDFCTGEFHLLQQYRPVLLQYLEKLLASAQKESHHRQDVSSVHTQYEFVSMVCHDLRAPITAIKGRTSLLQDFGYVDMPDGPATAIMSVEHRQSCLDAIMEQVDYLDVLVSGLLDVSQLQMGHFTLHPAEVDLGALCRSVIELFRYRIDQQLNHNNFRCCVEDNLPLAWADPVRVRQVLINLVENAVKYSPNGGPIEITLCTKQVANHETALLQTQDAYQFSQSGSYIYLTVRDWGIGIPDYQQDALFKPFVRLEHSLAMNIPGNGLGLYISCKLVKAMQGQIFLNSNQGHGTCITFALPVISSSLDSALHISKMV